LSGRTWGVIVDGKHTSASPPPADCENALG
jgi:hypothetical protein